MGFIPSCRSINTLRSGRISILPYYSMGVRKRKASKAPAPPRACASGKKSESIRRKRFSFEPKCAIIGAHWSAPGSARELSPTSAMAACPHHGRAREGRSPLASNRLRRPARRRRVLIFAPGNPISQSKNRFHAIFACAAKRREQKLEGVVGGAESKGFCGFRPWAKLPRLKLKI